MLKIRALNRESSSDEDVPIIRREAQEEIALELYNKALRLQTEDNDLESEKILSQIIEENIPLLENNGGLPKSMSTLKYSCHTNIGNVFLKQNKVNEALQTYLKAAELDGTDVTLWYKIGRLSLKENKFHQAAYAFSKGLECSESHWPCLDQLISILYATRDTIGCLEYIGKALILDSDYVKGLVLRKQIYQDNPAAKEYYQLYNPEYIWEPPLDVDIDLEEEKIYLEEAQSLCDTVTEVEKSFGPKPLQTIPLPKPLSEQTWISLAETVTYLHQYITDNDMSHFTMIDMSKCMSQSSETISCSNSKPEKESEFKFEENVEVDGVIKSSEQINGCNGDENMEVETIVERRFSVNSETNTDAQENTPSQTDNDEEQNMEHDNEEPDENVEIKSEKVKVRGSKRKRDLLSDLQIWGWHSKRKPPKKVKDKDFTIEDALNRIIPKALLKNRIDIEKYNIGDDSMNTMDLYNLYMNDNVNYLSPIHSPKSVNYEPYFKTDREKDDVHEFWTRKRDRCDAVVLIKELVFKLSKLWHYKWPKELVPLYITAYNMFREHCDPPQVFCGDWTFDAMRDDALATILYGELLSFSSDGKETIHPTSLGYLQLISGWAEQWADEYPSFFSRVYWLRSYMFRKENCNDLAARSLELIQEVIEEQEAKSEEKFMLSLPNCFKYGLITSQITEKILKHLELMNSLATVENLFNAEKYAEVVDIVKQTFLTSTHPQVGRMGRPAQLGILLHSLWFTNLEECFVWTEECLNEALDHFLKPKRDFDKWEKIIEKCLAFMHEIIKKESVSVIDILVDDKKMRLVENLAKILLKQLNTEHVMKIPLECITPWILLHYILHREEQRQYALKRAHQGKHEKFINEDYYDEEELYPSIAILFSAHDFLGRKGWCLTNQGELLHFILDTVLDRLDTPIFENFKDKIDIHLEQAFFCLYQHPSKKNKVSRHLADHNVEPLPLVWERAFQLYEFFGPDHLPEFNSYKNASISAEMEQLLKRIIALVPSQNAPHAHLSKIVDYIYGKTEKLPEAIEFPRKVAAIYYLIGDYFFKQKEFTKCIKYFQLDLCINPKRLDSWACLGLSYAAQLDAKLNHCVKFKSESEFLDKAKCATICFKQSLDISPDHLILCIEFGTFQYTVHSFCSRILKFESENLSMEKFEYLENQKNHYLDSSGNSFEKAIGLYEMEETNEPDERWLQYYILGKIAEKKQKEPTEYLQYYLTASTLLNENNAEYPDKINYTNPQHLAVEALELHYRIHASVLKYLELHEGKDIPNSLGMFFTKCLNTSSCMKKPSPPPPPPLPPQPPPPPATQPTDVLQNPPENSQNTSAGNSTSFQDQFLNSISKLSDKDLGIPLEEENDIVMEESKTLGTEVIKSPQSDVLEKTSDIVGEMLDKKDNAESPNSVSDNIILENKEKSPKPDVVTDHVTIDEKVPSPSKEKMIKPDPLPAPELNEDVIMIIDSDEEVETKNKDAIKSTEKDDKIELTETPKKDVQELLDEMMVETMKETEQQHNEVDSDMSGTSKVEEVVVKDEGEGKLSASEADDGNKEKKISDSEIDIENKKNSNESSSSGSSSSSSSSSSESDSDDDTSDTSSSSSTDDNEHMSNNEISQLIDRCVLGLEICIIRLGQNYKALYRLAHLYFNYKSKKDVTKSKQLLLGEYKCKDGNTVGGLFGDRKPNNFFNGIWRIPSTEIDRPGSLSAHMSRCISLVLQILRLLNDNKTLIDLAIQLRKTPEPDKIYIKDVERAAFSDQALTMCTQCLRPQMKNVETMTNTQKAKLLQEIHKVYQRVQKHIPGKEGVFANMLVDVYKKFIKEKIPDNVNIVELATKFCLQNKQAEKQKLNAANNPLPLPRTPGITAPPVLPSPATIAAAHPVLPKKVGAGRPRGRPPKIPGQVRQPRAKNPSAPGMPKAYDGWRKTLYDQTYAYEYIKHYQDELIKHYSQNMSIGQLTQLSQVLTQGQLNNPLANAGLTNQFLNQSGLLNPSSLVKQMSASGGLHMLSSNQFMDSLKHLSPSLKKKLVADQAVSSLTAEQKKLFDTMLPPLPKPTNKANAPPISTSSTGGATKSKSSSLSKMPAALSKPNNNNEPIKTKPAGIPLGVTCTTNLSATSTSNIFKDLNTPSTFEVPKVPKEIVKDRPNLSITPVNLPPPTTVSPSFIRPVTTSPSSGKTLQEKLAEKKKEQLNKQLKSTIESEIRAEALMKGMTIPNIPSSLTLSKTTVPISNLTFPGNPIQIPPISKPVPTISTTSKPISSVSKSVPNVTPQVASSFSKFPMNFSHPLTTPSLSLPPKKQMKMTTAPPSINFSKSSVPVPTPQFPVDSGISISQISQYKEKKKTNVPSPSKAETRDILKKLTVRGSVDVSRIKSSQATHVTKKKRESSPLSNTLMKKQLSSAQFSGLEIIAKPSGSALTDKKSPNTPKQKPDEYKQVVPTSKHKPNEPKQAISTSATQKDLNQYESRKHNHSSDDDVICLD